MKKTLTVSYQRIPIFTLYSTCQLFCSEVKYIHRERVFSVIYFNSNIVRYFPQQKCSYCSCLHDSSHPGYVKWAPILTPNTRFWGSFSSCDPKWTFKHFIGMQSWPIVKVSIIGYNICMNFVKIEWYVPKWRLFKLRLIFGRSHPRNKFLRVQTLERVCPRKLKLKYHRLIKLQFQNRLLLFSRFFRFQIFCARTIYLNELKFGL